MTTIPSTEQLQGLWKQQLGAAKTAWARLTDDELLRLEGNQERLAGLVQERYALSRAEADRQVERFFAAWKA
jgi:uncharacterized protein YjbJ (UPF0337 family)